MLCRFHIICTVTPFEACYFQKQYNVINALFTPSEPIYYRDGRTKNVKIKTDCFPLYRTHHIYNGTWFPHVVQARVHTADTIHCYSCPQNIDMRLLVIIILIKIIIITCPIMCCYTQHPTRAPFYHPRIVFSLHKTRMRL